MSLILYALLNRLKDWETALVLYEDMKKAGLQRTDIMVTSLLSAVGSSGKLDRLHKVHLLTAKFIYGDVSFLLDMMLVYLTCRKSEVIRLVRLCPHVSFLYENVLNIPVSRVHKSLLVTSFSCFMPTGVR